MLVQMPKSTLMLKWMFIVTKIIRYVATMYTYLMSECCPVQVWSQGRMSDMLVLVEGTVLSGPWRSKGRTCPGPMILSRKDGVVRSLVVEGTHLSGLKMVDGLVLSGPSV